MTTFDPVELELASQVRGISSHPQLVHETLGKIAMAAKLVYGQTFQDMVNEVKNIRHHYAEYDRLAKAEKDAIENGASQEIIDQARQECSDNGAAFKPTSMKYGMAMIAMMDQIEADGHLIRPIKVETFRRIDITRALYHP